MTCISFALLLHLWQLLLSFVLEFIEHLRLDLYLYLLRLRHVETKTSIKGFQISKLHPLFSLHGISTTWGVQWRAATSVIMPRPFLSSGQQDSSSSLEGHHASKAVETVTCQVCQGHGVKLRAWNGFYE